MEKYSNKCDKSVTLFVFLNIYNNCRLKGAHYIHNWNMFKNQNDDIVCALFERVLGIIWIYCGPNYISHKKHCTHWLNIHLSHMRRNVQEYWYLSSFLIFLFFFSVRLLSVPRGHSVFSFPPQRPMTSDFRFQIISISFFFLS